jgi:hypothetical protein
MAGPAGFIAGRAAAGAWTTVANPDLNGNQAGSWNNFTLRQVIASAQLSASGGTKIRITFKAGSAAAGLTLTKVYIGNHPGTGDAYDMTGPVQLLFGGSASSGAIASNTTKASDGVPFTRIAGRDLIVAMYTASAGVNNYAKRVTLTGYSNYYKSGDDAATADATGYTSYSVDDVIGVHLIELFV